MSISRSPKLRIVAVETARQLRKAETAAEKILLARLRNRQFNGKKFLRQHPIMVEFWDKETFFVADFYFAQGKLVIELDGDIHKQRIARDRTRDEVLRQLGYRVIRFRNVDVESNCGEILRKVAALIELNSPPRSPSLRHPKRGGWG